MAGCETADDHSENSGPQNQRRSELFQCLGTPLNDCIYKKLTRSGVLDIITRDPGTKRGPVAFAEAGASLPMSEATPRKKAGFCSPNGEV